MSADNNTTHDTEVASQRFRRRPRLRAVLMLGGPALVLIAAIWLYLHGGRYESTENAYLQTGMVAISPVVAGTVISVEVEENQRVRKGDVLFRIDPASYEAAVAEAEAALADARGDVASLRADIAEAESEIAAAKARYDYAVKEAARQRSLLEEGIASRAQYDVAMTEARTARVAIAAAEAKAQSLRARLSAAGSGAIEDHPEVRKAASRLEKTRIDLEHTVVRAPQDGIVTRVNQLQVGSYVAPGRPVFMLTGLKYWVQANFKENQLRYMRVGQPATIEIDAFPGHTIKGRVESFSPGTGSSFSILPAENATGNWVKVVQRVPVQIAIEQAPRDLPLAAGLSVVVEVDTGHKRHIFGADTPPSSPRKQGERTARLP
ncbi:MAG: HlyD family secretion protein [Novosphingobium sp.]|nr:HlyD family secretion protein [Novosphingobium sp.]